MSDQLAKYELHMFDNILIKVIYNFIVKMLPFYPKPRFQTKFEKLE